jgi:N-methylhydantoinase B
MVRTNRPSRPCEGLAGGQPGALSQNVLNPGQDAVSLPRQTHLHLEVKPGDRVFHAISGSGGHGDPWEREPAQVQKDVQDEKVTIDGAR